MRVLMPGLLAFAIAATLGACGSGSEKKAPPAVSAQQRGVLDTVDSLQAASRRGDGQQICTEIFTTRLARSIEAASKTTCAKEVKEKLFSRQAELALGRDVQFKGGRAVATVREQTGKISTLMLVQQAGAWRIDAVKPGPNPSS
ncbi:MAG: hypothetical protein H0T96_02000 [Thermoleophilaceae bacterium]|jgi:hypothetical protein|nr:hypothetical protein [Thermoleophilaceae bacterium]